MMARALVLFLVIAFTAPAFASPDAGVEVEEVPTLPETVVTATRYARPVLDVPTAVTVMTREEIERSPSLTTDALVRSVPSAATFRRSTSLSADPSSQGVNLRGVGPSGVSRALVLVDGIPANEPFGNWVFWRAFPRNGLQRVEVAPGPGSALYGSSALGGVVNLESKRLTPATIEADLAGGNRGTFEGGAFASHQFGPVSAGIEGEYLRSDGFPVISADEAGAVDTWASGRHGSIAGRLELRPGDGWRVASRVGYFDQAQSGGTRFTNSAVQLWSGALTAERSLSSGGALTASAFVRDGVFLQDRARITEDRSSEELAASQRVPTSDFGGSVQWSSTAPLGSFEHTPSVGLDLRRAVGTSYETIHAVTVTDSTVLRRDSGGEQQFLGAFAQEEVDFGAVTLLGTLRFDVWRNVGGQRTLVRGDGSTDTRNFDDRIEQQLSPRLGAVYRPIERLALRANVGSAFRAPTLNELYRPFQVGTIRTAANEALLPERLWGAEAGFDLEPAKALLLRATGFWNSLQDPIANVTLAEPAPDGSQRQRQNLGAARVAGVELAAEARVMRRFILLASYAYIDATVVEAPGNEALVGKRLPQDPAHRGFASVTFDDPELLTATVQLRVIGPQFEDDLNTLEMGGYPLVDASLSRRIGYGLEVFAAVENAFDRRYLVGRAGIDTWGAPLMVRAGLRLRQRPQ